MILFGKDEEFQEINKQLVQEICSRTLEYCYQYRNNDQLSDAADLIEGFFLLLSNFVKKVPHLVFNNDVDAAALFQFGRYLYIE